MRAWKTGVRPTGPANSTISVVWTVAVATVSAAIPVSSVNWRFSGDDKTRWSLINRQISCNASSPPALPPPPPVPVAILSYSVRPTLRNVAQRSLGLEFNPAMIISMQNYCCCFLNQCTVWTVIIMFVLTEANISHFCLWKFIYGFDKWRHDGVLITPPPPPCDSLQLFSQWWIDDSTWPQQSYTSEILTLPLVFLPFKKNRPIGNESCQIRILKIID